MAEIGDCPDLIDSDCEGETAPNSAPQPASPEAASVLSGHSKAGTKVGHASKVAEARQTAVPVSEPPGLVSSDDSDVEPALDEAEAERLQPEDSLKGRVTGRSAGLFRILGLVGYLMPSRSRTCIQHNGLARQSVPLTVYARCFREIKCLQLFGVLLGAEVLLVGLDAASGLYACSHFVLSAFKQTVHPSRMRA